MSSAAEKQATRAIAERFNENTAYYFAASMLGLLAVISIFHRMGEILRSSLSNNDSPAVRRLISITRTTRSILLLKIPGFTSIGHACLFILYLAINITLTFQNLDHNHLLGSFAKRMGWITACNLSLVVLLALKNTPLAFLTSFSYERLNVFHQTAGYCTVVSAIVHAITYLVKLSQLDSFYIVGEQNQIMGSIAGSILVILMTALSIGRIPYEVFHAAHTSSFVILIIALGFHRPLITGKVIYIFLFTACTWAFDSIYRFLMLCLFAFGNTASVVPLQHGGVRIILSRAPKKAVPGSHVFIWIPRIRKAQMHPFTVLSTKPLELVILAHDGFTNDLRSFASKNPGNKLRASCYGPYGTIPNFTKFDHVVLIAGGIGASFTFGVALDLVRKSSTSTTKPVIHFIWVIREREQQSWFSKELTEISSSPLVLSTIHVTGSKPSTSSRSTLHKLSDDKVAQAPGDEIPSPTRPKTELDIDMEKGGPKTRPGVNNHSLSSSSSSVPIILGRPSIKARINEIVGSTEKSDSTIIAVCGPEGLTLEAREAVARVVSAGTRSVTLHCEQFGW